MQAKAYIFKKEGHFKMARKKIIAGNWKMNKTPSEAVALVNELKPLVANEVEPRKHYGSEEECSRSIESCRS